MSASNCDCFLQPLERRVLLNAAFIAAINFQAEGAPTPAGYQADVGHAFALRAGGLRYGWNADNTSSGRDRNLLADQRYDTLLHLQKNGQFTWEIEVPGGNYSVRIVAGDHGYIDSVYRLSAEGVLAVSGTPTWSTRFFEGNVTVPVTDGRLTISSASGSANNKIAFIEIRQIVEEPPAPPPSGFTSMRINFQPASMTTVPDYYRVDSGAAFGLRANGFTYGWSSDNSATRLRNNSASPDARYDTLNHMQYGGANHTWELAVPDGTYSVRVVAGDPSYFDSVYRINVEGVLTVSGTPSSGNRWFEGTSTVIVRDGRLTISNASGAANNKLAFVEIRAGSSAIPVVSVTAPDASASENGDSGLFRISRSGSLDAPLAVSLRTGGTATHGVDYQPIATTVTIPAGSAFADVLIAPIDDALVEGPESVVLSLASSASYSLAAQHSATVTIADNDASAPFTGTLTWAQRASSIARVEGMAATVGGFFYVFGGYADGSWRPIARVDRYDPATNTWTRLGDMPERISHCATAADDRYVYMAGGYPGTATGQAFATTKTRRYDTVTDTWTDMKPLPAARGGGSMVLLNRTLYYIAGSDANRADHAHVWSLKLDDPNANWVSRAPLPQPRNHFGAVALNGQIYVAAGQTGQEQWVSFKSDSWRYDPQSDRWSSIAPVPGVPRSHHMMTTFVYNGRLILMGGETSSDIAGKPTALRQVESYDPATNKWTFAGLLPIARSAAFGGVIGDKLILYGGYNGSYFGVETWVGEFK